MASPGSVCFSHTLNESAEAGDPCEQENNYIHGHASILLTASYLMRAGVKTALILTAAYRRPKYR
jgi:hypothetical protein